MIRELDNKGFRVQKFRKLGSLCLVHIMSCRGLGALS